MVRLVPPLACLALISFLWAVNFGQTPQILHVTGPPFLIILSVSLITLAQITTYPKEAASGVLLFLVGNQMNMLPYVLRKISLEAVKIILPFTLCATFFLIFLHPATTIMRLLLFATVHFFSTFSTLIFTHILSSLSIRPDHSPLLSLFIIWPFLIPTTLLSLMVLEETHTFASLFDTIGLILGLFMLTFGVALLIIPRLLTSAFDE